MQTSPSVKTIAEALLGFHKEVGTINKESTNPFFKSKYADLATILKAIHQPLINNGLTVLQFPEGEHGLTTRLLHVSGEWMESTYFMHPTKSTPQDAGSAITYQRRYAVGAILSLNIDEDDDGNKASQPKEKKEVLQAQKNGVEKPWLNENTPQFTAALTYLNKGGLITDIEKKYRLSAATKEALLGQVELTTA
jgi:hypothetical protein